MRIAIVDDDIRAAGKIEFALMDTSKELQIDKFEQGNAFLQRIKNGVFYDLVFMDIFMGEENGIDIVRRMQKLSPSTQVIFCTTSRDYAVEAFDLNAVGYLVKPYTESNIVKNFARVGPRREHIEENVLLNSRAENQLFRVSEVVKLESDGHYTNIYLSSGNVSRHHSAYAEVTTKFVKGFIKIKRGISVNMAYIDRIKNGVVYLRDGSSYKIARGNKDFVVSRFTEFAIKGNKIV